LPTEDEKLKATTSVYVTDKGVLGPKPNERYLISLIEGSDFFKE